MPWTPLSPSRREDGLRKTARIAAWAGAALLGFAALQDQPPQWSLLLPALVAAIAGFVAGRTRAERHTEVGIDQRGRIAVRREDRPEERPEPRLRCVFAAPWLITLRQGTMLIPIWPDSLPGNTFRRLWVHIRWNSDRNGAKLPAGPEPRHSK